MKLISKEKTAVAFGEFIREARESQGLLQADVAKQLGVSRPYYSYIETGNRDIYFATAINICRILKLNINDFTKRLK